MSTEKPKSGSARKLHEKSHGVVHKSARRTRLRVPRKYRKPEKLHEVKQAIQSVPGVQSVEVNPATGSVLVHHAEDPGILGNIGAAIEEELPELMAALLMPEAEGAELGFEVLSKLFNRYFIVPREEGANGAATAGGADQPADAMHAIANDDRMTKMVPAAFFAAGMWTMVTEETLLGTLAPLALFYYGFDIYWKLQQEKRTRLLELKNGIADTTIPPAGLPTAAPKTIAKTSEESATKS